MACSSFRSGVRRALLAALLLLAGLSAALAEDCPTVRGKKLPCVSSVGETVMLEHQDRKNRLLRLARGSVKFEFFDELIGPEELGQPDFPEGMPILRVVAGQDVFFDSGSDVIRGEAYPLLDIIAESLKHEPPDVSLFVAGHTDSDGEEAYNRDLGLRRATSVAEALARRGIYQAAIYRVSFGELMPIDTNDTERGKARNRRVEFLFAARPDGIVQYLEKQPIASCAEALDDPQGSCRVRIEVPVERVAIAPGNEKIVIELEQRYRAIIEDKSLTPVQAERARQAIETERDRVPIDLREERVPIHLTLE